MAGSSQRLLEVCSDVGIIVGTRGGCYRFYWASSGDRGECPEFFIFHSFSFMEQKLECSLCGINPASCCLINFGHVFLCTPCFAFYCSNGTFAPTVEFTCIQCKKPFWSAASMLVHFTVRSDVLSEKCQRRCVSVLFSWGIIVFSIAYFRFWI